MSILDCPDMIESKHPYILFLRSIQDLPRPDRHSLWLEYAAARGMITKELKEIGAAYESALRSALGENLDYPDAAAGQEGSLNFYWRTGPHYASLQLCPEEGGCMVYLNQEGEACWEREFPLDSPPIDDDVLSQLRHFPLPTN